MITMAVFSNACRMAPFPPSRLQQTACALPGPSKHNGSATRRGDCPRETTAQGWEDGKEDKYCGSVLRSWRAGFSPHQAAIPLQATNCRRCSSCRKNLTSRSCARYA